MQASDADLFVRAQPSQLPLSCKMANEGNSRAAGRQAVLLNHFRPVSAADRLVRRCSRYFKFALFTLGRTVQGSSTTAMENNIQVTTLSCTLRQNLCIQSGVCSYQTILCGCKARFVTEHYCANLQTQACLAGDSAAYERRASNLDDVVIISALRTPMCKV